MVVTTMSEEGVQIQKGLSEWWSEESVYLLQRIERWAALARGYNRLRSHKFSRGRLTFGEVLEDDEERYISTDFESLRRSERMKSRSPDESRRINCCGTFNYQSNNRLDSTCLETYRYDHSIYFKTIGDIKRSKSGEHVGCKEDGDRCSDDEKVEWDVRVVNNSVAARGFTADRQMIVMSDGEVGWDCLDQYSSENVEKNRNVWPVVDISKLDTGKNCPDFSRKVVHQEDDQEDQRNNNALTQTFVSRSKSSLELKTQQSMTRILSFRTKRSPKVVQRPMVCGAGNVSWPGVLLTYTPSYIDPAIASSHNQVVKIK
ncbi:uncharacterized protein LOC135160332 isoform X1 [Diachasmimorpha longicaudata]|uniref:uncharacterized protein LOC135160332 isoform X1 n=1 Tax=Diachasmimorpha longicaudata TaxID=58733 RepID=UPI0030B8CF1F